MTMFGQAQRIRGNVLLISLALTASNA